MVEKNAKSRDASHFLFQDICTPRSRLSMARCPANGYADTQGFHRQYPKRVACRCRSCCRRRQSLAFFMQSLSGFIGSVSLFAITSERRIKIVVENFRS